MHIEEEHEEHSGDEELWLVSYADLMTLLFGFFVLMYSFAMAQKGSQIEDFKEGVARSFGGSYVPPYEQLTSEVQKQIKSDPVFQKLKLMASSEGLEITFQSGILFKSGQSELMPETRQAMKNLIKVIQSNIEGAEIYVTGHTDDAPISTKQYPSNWELSTARAASVVREFIKFGYNPSNLVVQGFGDTRPEYPNRDLEGRPIQKNRDKNRRVVIRVIAPGLIKDDKNGNNKDQKSADTNSAATKTL